MVEEVGEYSSNKEIRCSGAMICSKKTKRVILLQKANGKHNGFWGLVGGTNIGVETVWQGLCREIEEEVGFLPEFLKIIPLEKFVSNDHLFHFNTFFCIVEEEFIPSLSKEHKAWGWFNLKSLPKPIHKALDLSLRNKFLENKISTIIELIEIM
jgi:ADP-ribose pyrophosphatase YjhB (NUDIX family)